MSLAFCQKQAAQSQATYFTLGLALVDVIPLIWEACAGFYSDDHAFLRVSISRQLMYCSKVNHCSIQSVQRVQYRQ